MAIAMCVLFLKLVVYVLHYNPMESWALFKRQRLFLATIVCLCFWVTHTRSSTFTHLHAHMQAEPMTLHAAKFTLIKRQEVFSQKQRSNQQTQIPFYLSSSFFNNETWTWSLGNIWVVIIITLTFIKYFSSTNVYLYLIKATGLNLTKPPTVVFKTQIQKCTSFFYFEKCKMVIFGRLTHGPF